MKHKRKGIKMSWVRYGRGIAFGLVKGPNARKRRLAAAVFFCLVSIGQSSELETNPDLNLPAGIGEVAVGIGDLAKAGVKVQRWCHVSS